MIYNVTFWEKANVVPSNTDSTTFAYPILNFSIKTCILHAKLITKCALEVTPQSDENSILLPCKPFQPPFRRKRRRQLGCSLVV